MVTGTVPLTQPQALTVRLPQRHQDQDQDRDQAPHCPEQPHGHRTAQFPALLAPRVL